MIINEIIPKDDMLEYLQISNISIIRSHSDSDSLGNYMCMIPGGGIDDTYILHSVDIYNFSNNIGIDMINCDVVAFVGCYTASHPIQSLPKSAVAAGADTAIGFYEAIDCSEAEDWTDAFSLYYLSGYSADYAALEAFLDVGTGTSIGNICIETN